MQSDAIPQLAVPPQKTQPHSLRLALDDDAVRRDSAAVPPAHNPEVSFLPPILPVAVLDVPVLGPRVIKRGPKPNKIIYMRGRVK